MIISGAAIHCDGHGKCGLLATQTFLHFLAGLAAPPPSFYRHRVSTNLTCTSLRGRRQPGLMRSAIRWHSPQHTIPAQWEPYHQKPGMVCEAVNRGDNQAVKREMGKWFRVLRYRDNGISDVAADELYNFSLMVTPI